jgi:hypothetical protein
MKVYVPATVRDRLDEPESESAPLQEPRASQLVLLLETHETVVTPPTVNCEGEALTETVGTMHSPLGSITQVARSMEGRSGWRVDGFGTPPGSADAVSARPRQRRISSATKHACLVRIFLAPI